MAAIRFADVLGRLNTAVRAAGGESAFARAHGLDRREVHEALKGARHPGPGVLSAVGVRKLTVYELLDPAAVCAPAAAVPEPGTCACPPTAETVCGNPACPRQPAHLRQIPKPEAA